MNGTAGLGAVAGAQKPPDSAVLEQPAGRDVAFSAIVGALGYTSAQTSAPLESEPAASIGRIPAQDGNIVPLPYLNGLPGELLPALVGGGSRPRHAATQPGIIPPQLLSRAALSGRASETPAVAAFGEQLSDEITDVAAKLKRLPVAEALVLEREFVTPVGEAAAARNDATLLAQGLKVAQTLPGGEVLLQAAPASATAAANPVGAGAVTAEAPFPLHHARFAEGFSQQVRLMASDGVQLARISINPPELGPVELRIVVRNDEAAVQLASPHGAVRDALEEALPRLREQFEQAGMRLGDSGVFNELPGRSPTQRDADEGFTTIAALSDAEPDGPERVASIRHGFVDAYV